MKTDPISSQGKADLQFFGKVNASISHELKNILAIISETMGFVDDLVGLARQGKALDLSILENSSRSVAEEIERGFDTIRQMNRFAHSVDAFDPDADLQSSLDLAVNLTRFLSISKPIEVTGSTSDVKLPVPPFAVVNWLYTILCDLLASTSVSGIKIHTDIGGNGELRLIFSAPEGNGRPLKLSDSSRQLCRQINVVPGRDQASGCLVLTLPALKTS